MMRGDAWMADQVPSRTGIILFRQLVLDPHELLGSPKIDCPSQ
jgi:hypothetical protein